MICQLSIDDCLLLQRIDQAIARMEQRAAELEARNHPGNRQYIDNLRQKRRLVEAGNYHVSKVDVAPGVREAGRGICYSVKYLWRRPNA